MKKSNHIEFLYLFFMFYMFWGWIFTKTVFGDATYVYMSFLFLLFGFLYKFLKCVDRKSVRTTKPILLWLPFYLYTCIQWLIEGDVQRFSYWMVCLILVAIGANERISEKIPYKLLFYFGLFAVIGILIQMFSPSFYASYISPLFISDNAEMWVSSEYGFNGFTYQLAATAEILVCAECVILCLWNEMFPQSKPWLKLAFLVLIIICVFLTGKRTNSAIALILPFLLSLISDKNSEKKWIFLVFAIGAFAFFVNFLLSNSSSLLSSSVFRRTAMTIVEYQSGGNISAGREDLWTMATKLYHDNPVFGIGVGQFAHQSGTGTDVHNIYLQCLCEQGIIGFILFIIPLVYCFIRTIKLIRVASDKRRALLMLSLAIQVNYILEGITENMNVNLDGFIMYAIAIAIMVDCENNDYNYEPPSLHI